MFIQKEVGRQKIIFDIRKDIPQINKKWISNITLNWENKAPTTAAEKNPIDQKAWLLFMIRLPKACSTRSASRLIATSTTATNAPHTIRKKAKNEIWFIATAENCMKQIDGIPMQIIFLNGIALTSLSANTSVTWSPRGIQRSNKPNSALSIAKEVWISSKRGNIAPNENA